MNNISLHKWEVQQFVNYQWVNAIICLSGSTSTPEQFDTQEEAQAELDTLLAELTSEKMNNVFPDFDPSNYRIHKELVAPLYDSGYRFRAYTRSLKCESEWVLSYRYHNGITWRYHMGLVLASESDPVPPPYALCQASTGPDSLNLKEKFVDWSTWDEDEITCLTRLPPTTNYTF